jgi:hypothetical protein
MNISRRSIVVAAIGAALGLASASARNLADSRVAQILEVKQSDHQVSPPMDANKAIICAQTPWLVRPASLMERRAGTGTMPLRLDLCN